MWVPIISTRISASTTITEDNPLNEIYNKRTLPANVSFVIVLVLLEVYSFSSKREGGMID